MLDLDAIEQLRERALRDSFRYLNPAAQHLIEREIPALIEALRAIQHRADAGDPPSAPSPQEEPRAQEAGGGATPAPSPGVPGERRAESFRQ